MDFCIIFQIILYNGEFSHETIPTPYLSQLLSLYLPLQNRNSAEIAVIQKDQCVHTLFCYELFSFERLEKEEKLLWQ